VERDALAALTHALVEDLRPLPRLRDIDAPLRARVDALFDVRRERAPRVVPPASPRRASVRVVHWNIEHGNHADGVRDALLTHPVLRGPDVVCLNEVDLGMARSGNRDVAFELAETLGFFAAWVPMFLELGAGRHDDVRLAAGRSNRESILGVALLSRWPLRDVHVVPLPVRYLAEFGFRELRMIGRHVALIAEVVHPAAPFRVATSHLTVHGAVRDRAAQMRALLAALPGDGVPTILTGDFNTHTHDRTSFVDSVRGFLHLLGPRNRVRERFLFPDHPVHAPREPLFGALARAGFAWRPFMDDLPTLRLHFDRLPELEFLPGPLHCAVLRALRPLSARAMMRLDWIAARGCGGGRGETITGLDEEPRYVADHRPVVAEITLPA
jgi:endonuclease/exonuclease/phosphatase family metal-dependent hydrolase